MPHANHKKPLFMELIHCLKIFIEYVTGIIKFRRISPCITIYGSARTNADTKTYQDAVYLAKQLADLGYTIMTGGGPGIMQAANKGAYAASKSAGCSIFIPYEKFANKYLNSHHHCHYFFIRKILLTKFSHAFIAFPGGLGTLDEVFEMLTLIKTKRMQDLPVILIGVDFWQPLINFIKEKMITLGTVSPDEIACITITDDLEQAINTVNTFYEK